MAIKVAINGYGRIGRTVATAVGHAVSEVRSLTWSARGV